MTVYNVENRKIAMSIYLNEKNPSKHKPFDDASQDIVDCVRYLEVIAGKSANTAFSYYCDLRTFSRFMKRRKGLVEADLEMKDIDPKGLDTAFWASETKEDIYEYLENSFEELVWDWGYLALVVG